MSPLLESRRSRRKRSEEGATAVMVTVLLSAFLAMAAVSIDYAGGVAERTRLQNAADSAAIAIAEKCGLKLATCGTAEGTYYVDQNSSTSTSRSFVPAAPSYAAKSQTVHVAGTRTNALGKWVGKETTDIGATATASWGDVPIRGDNVLPMGIGFCQWQANAPAPGLLEGPNFTYKWNSSGTSVNCTTDQLGTYNDLNRANGKTLQSENGRAVLLTNGFLGIGSTCDFSPNLLDLWSDQIEIVANAIWNVDTCMTDTFAELDTDKPVLIPIWAKVKGSWWFFTWTERLMVVGFAPFKIERWWNKPILFGSGSYSGSCEMPNSIFFFNFGGRCSGVEGKFVRTADTSAYYDSTYGKFEFAPNGTDLGAVRVKLTN